MKSTLTIAFSSALILSACNISDTTQAPVAAPPNLTIGVMVGTQYAGYCSFAKPADAKNFVFDDESTWRYVFSTNLETQAARMLINDKLESFNFVDRSEDAATKTITENYTSSSNNGMQVTVVKQPASHQPTSDETAESTDYTGTITVKQQGVSATTDYAGDCGV